MDTAMPTLAHGCVVGRLLQSISDGSDAGVLPDVAVHAGYINFSPAVSYAKLSPSTIITYHPITAELDTHGHLHPSRATSDTTGIDAEDAIRLTVGVWSVSYQVPGADLPSHVINVTTAHTAESPLALFANLGEPESPVVPPDSEPSVSMSDAEILAALEGI